MLNGGRWNRWEVKKSGCRLSMISRICIQCYHSRESKKFYIGCVDVAKDLPKNLTMKTRGNKGVYFGNELKGIREYTLITQRQIVEIVEFALGTCVFKLRSNKILKQKEGIPMGSSLSLILAVLTCIYCELEFTVSLGVDVEKITGLRYIDDLCILLKWH